MSTPQSIILDQSHTPRVNPKSVTFDGVTSASPVLRFGKEVSSFSDHLSTFDETMSQISTQTSMDNDEISSAYQPTPKTIFHPIEEEEEFDACYDEVESEVILRNYLEGAYDDNEPDLVDYKGDNSAVEEVYQQLCNLVLNDESTEQLMTQIGGRRIPDWKSRRITWRWENEALPNALETGEVRVLGITWNMCGKKPPSDLSEFLNLRVRHHVYVVSTQECLRSIKKSLLNEDKTLWEEGLQRNLGSDYFKVASTTMGPTHIIAFAHVSLKSVIKDVQTDWVCTGVGNVVKNKGGVGLSFKIGERSLMFLGSHLTASQHNTVKRNYDFKRVEKNMKLCQDVVRDRASDRADCSFFLGDLNYRLEGRREAVEKLIEFGMIDVLRQADQYVKEFESGNTAQGFSEAQINFVPTYKYDRWTNVYDTSKKMRIPSWTDRILYKDNSGHLTVENYDSLMDWSSSDHKPVVGQFTVKWNEQ